MALFSKDSFLLGTLLWLACSAYFATSATCVADQCTSEPDNVNLLQGKVKVAVDSMTSDADEEKQDDVNIKPKKKKQTKCHVMYLMADNNLDNAIAGDLEELISNTQALSKPYYYPFVYIDRHANYGRKPVQGLKGKDGWKDVSFHSGVRYIKKNLSTRKLQVYEEYGEKDSDDKATVEEFLTWALTQCKAQDPKAKVMLTFSSHGGFWLGFGGDKNNQLLQHDSHVSARRHRQLLELITNGEIRQAIKAAMDKTVPKINKLDLLGFDACFMMTYSTMYLYEGISKWYLGSQATEPGHGWDYTTLDPQKGTLKVATSIIKNFVSGLHGYWQHQSPKTLAVFADPDFKAFRSSFDKLAVKMKNATTNQLTHIWTARSKSVRLDLVDLGDFLSKANQECSLHHPSCGDDIENALKDALKKYNIMLHKGYVQVGNQSYEEANATGMSIDFRPYKPWTADYDNWQNGKLGFTASRDRAWNQFLESFWKRFDHKCIDTDNGAKDKWNNGCYWYRGIHPHYCGAIDDHDFDAKAMCCGCK